MRYLVICAVGGAFAFFETGIVAVFGAMTLVLLGFIAQDIQRFTQASRARGELGAVEGGDGVATLADLRTDIASLSTQARATHHEVAMIKAKVAVSSKGPWEH